MVLRRPRINIARHGRELCDLCYEYTLVVHSTRYRVLMKKGIVLKAFLHTYPLILLIYHRLS
jgi:hypothetical protein